MIVMDSSDLLLDIRDLKTYFFLDQGILRAVDGVSFSLGRGETLGIVGESGCGKSVTARSILRLLPQPIARDRRRRDALLPGRSGDGRSGHARSPGPEIRDIRGNDIAMIFQEPMTSLNPVYTIGDQIMEAVLLHQNVSKEEARERAIEMLGLVGIPEPAQRVDQYQHQFSGGMRQRAMIAMALSCNPRILIADEPTTALDVTIEAQILDLILQIQQETDMALMMITHDLNVIGEIADKVIVMYLGKIVERAGVDEIFDHPKHPYTQGLVQSLPLIGRGERLTPISGNVPSPHERPRGCSFAPRCPQAMAHCHESAPPMFQVDEGSSAACWLYQDQVHQDEVEVAHG